VINYNCLDLLGHRRLVSIPVHFARCNISAMKSTTFQQGNEIIAWITIKLQSRFAMSLTPVINKDQQLATEWVVGFEDHSELTQFVLACPYLRN
jgi:hypothetical protein